MSSRPCLRQTGRVVVDPAGTGGRRELREAAARELAQEIGLVVAPAALEGPVWLRRHVGPFAGMQIDSRETFFVLRDVVHEVDPSGRTELEALGEEPHRWWSVAEIARSAESFASEQLAVLLAELLERPWAGAPAWSAEAVAQ